MIVQNPWVGYLDRTYEQIRQSCLTRLSSLAPEITDLSEGNPLIILLSQFSGIGEIINFYIDQALQNSYLDTVKNWVKALKLVNHLDYNVNVARPASADLLLTFWDTSNQPAALTSNYILPAGTQFQTSNNLIFTLSDDVLINSGLTFKQVTVSQYIIITNQPLGLTTGAIGQEILLGNNIAINSVSLLIGTDIWQEVETFAYSKPTSKHFKVTLNEDREAIIIFGDGVFGAIPTPGLQVIADFKTTQGALGNKLLAGSINAFVSTPTLPGINTIQVSNTLPTTGGSDYESFREIKFRAPLSVRTLRRFVTPKDGEDLAMQYPGVFRAKVDFCCNRDSKIKVYIGPNGGGLPAQQLLDGVDSYLECRKVVGMPDLELLPAGESQWVLNVFAKARFRQDPALCYQDILSTLLLLGSYENSEINKAIRYSDIIAPIDNLPRIDYANIVTLKTIPYPRPINHYTPLNWVADVNQTTEDPINWKLEMSLAGIRVFRNNVFVGTYPIGATYSDGLGLMTFTVTPGPYSVGMTWTFKTYKINQDQAIKDYSIPVINQAMLFITVEPANGDNCQPCCTC